MPNPVEGLLKVYEDMIEVLLALFLTEDSSVEDLLCGAPSCSEAYLFFIDDLLRLWLQPLSIIFSMTLLWVTDEPYCSVVLALLQVAFLGKCDG